MTYPRWGDYPVLDQLIGANFSPYFEEAVLDPIMVIDDYLAACTEDERRQAHEEIHNLVERSPDDESAEKNLQTFLGQSGVPEGSTWRDLLLLVQARIDRGVVARGALLHLVDSDHDVRTHWRSSRFLDVETAEDSCGQVLRAHEAALRGWANNSEGLWRQHYLADVGRVAGTVTDGRMDVEDAPTRLVAVVMKIDHETGQPFIFDAWPELPLGTAWRERFPELCHVFGGYFGAAPGTRWQAQLNLVQSTQPPARDRIKEQFDELLTLTDDELRGAVEALGSHVLPDAMRRWLELMRWRLDAYDDRHPIPVWQAP